MLFNIFYLKKVVLKYRGNIIMEKVLTISIAAYQVEKYIKNTLESLLIKNMNGN